MINTNLKELIDTSFEHIYSNPQISEIFSFIPLLVQTRKKGHIRIF